MNDYKKLAIEEANAVENCANTAFDHAIKCGEYLTKVKANFGPRGGYQEWIQDNMPVSIKQCSKYVYIYENMDLYVKLTSRIKTISKNIDEVDQLLRVERARIDKENYDNSPEGKAKKEKREKEEAIAKKKAEERKAFFEEVKKEQAHERAERAREQFKQGFYDSLGITITKDDPYYKLALLILKIGDKNLEKGIFKLLKHYSHPDKNQSDGELFKEICKLEVEINEQ